MPRLLDLKLTGAKLALRLALAILLGGLAFVLFYFLPASASSLLGNSLSTAGIPGASGVVSSLINPSLPLIGLAAALFVFLGVLLRGTRIYGPIVIVTGLVFAAYVYTAFQGGTISLTLPPGLQGNASGTIAINASTLMYLFLLGPVLTILKGVVLTVMKAEEPQLFPAQVAA